MKTKSGKRSQYEPRLWQLNSWGLGLPNVEWQQLISLGKSGLSWLQVSLELFTRNLELGNVAVTTMITHYTVFKEILRQFWSVDLVKEISPKYLLLFTRITACCLDLLVFLSFLKVFWNEQNVLKCKHMLRLMGRSFSPWQGDNYLKKRQKGRKGRKKKISLKWHDHDWRLQFNLLCVV